MHDVRQHSIVTPVTGQLQTGRIRTYPVTDLSQGCGPETHQSQVRAWIRFVSKQPYCTMDPPIQPSEPAHAMVAVQLGDLLTVKALAPTKARCRRLGASLGSLEEFLRN